MGSCCLGLSEVSVHDNEVALPATKAAYFCLKRHTCAFKCCWVREQQESAGGGLRDRSGWRVTKTVQVELSLQGEKPALDSVCEGSLGVLAKGERPKGRVLARRFLPGQPEGWRPGKALPWCPHRQRGGQSQPVEQGLKQVL